MFDRCREAGLEAIGYRHYALAGRGVAFDCRSYGSKASWRHKERCSKGICAPLYVARGPKAARERNLTGVSSVEEKVTKLVRDREASTGLVLVCPVAGVKDDRGPVSVAANRNRPDGTVAKLHLLT